MMQPEDLKTFLAQVRALRRRSDDDAVRMPCEHIIGNIKLLLGKRRGDRNLEAMLRRNVAGLERALLGKRPDDEPFLLNWRTYLDRDQSPSPAAP